MTFFLIIYCTIVSTTNTLVGYNRLLESNYTLIYNNNNNDNNNSNECL